MPPRKTGEEELSDDACPLSYTFRISRYSTGGVKLSDSGDTEIRICNEGDKDPVYLGSEPLYTIRQSEFLTVRHLKGVYEKPSTDDTLGFRNDRFAGCHSGRRSAHQRRHFGHSH